MAAPTSFNTGAPPVATPSAKAMYNPYTVTAMSRWSILTKDLPPVDDIKVLHVYDFDNTLFKTPLPNQSLWAGQSIGTLSTEDAFASGGWWHDSRILAATGEGVEIEEPRGWAGWWNETIVELVQLSMKQTDALCVLLTGRSEAGYRDLIRRMLKSKGLDFDIAGLKPAVSPTSQKFSSTMHFKQLFLTALVETYKNATELRIYEDRPKHVKGFQEFFEDYNKKLGASVLTGKGRGPIATEVIQVAEMAVNLDPVIEVAHVQRMVDEHNGLVAKAKASGVASRMQKRRLNIKKTVFFTGYLLNPGETEKLLALTSPAIPDDIPGDELKILANSVLITARACPPSILEKVGGMGAPMKWEITAVGSFKDGVWAAKVRPVPAHARYHTDNKEPMIVIALRRGARPIDAGKITNWAPVSEKLVVGSVVRERMLLRIETEDAYESDSDVIKGPKRKHSVLESPSSYSASHKEPHTSHHHHPHDGNTSSTNSSPYVHGRNRGYHSSPYNRGGGRGGSGSRGGSVGGTPRGGFRQHSRGGGSNRGGPGTPGRGRGGNSSNPGSGTFGYRSLDDPGQGSGDHVNYDDNQPPRGPQGWAPPQGPSGYRTSRPMGPPESGTSGNIDNYY